MKKLLFGTIILLAFNGAILITQMSCKKEATAQTNPPPGNENGLKQLNKILFVKTLNATNQATITGEIWMCDLDGSRPTKVNVTVPDGSCIVSAKLSPDGETIIFSTVVRQDSAQEGGVYSCKADGSSVKKIMRGYLADGLIQVQGVY